MRKVIFWHCFLVNDWKKVVEEQFELLMSSGLHKEADKIHIGAVGMQEQLEIFEKFIKKFSSNKIKIRTSTENFWEYLTLHWVKEYSDKNDAYVLYFHTKGISVPVHSKERVSREDWRHCMQYFNIELWQDCVAKLDEGYQTCGILLSERPSRGTKKYFYGNFWWATTDYLKTCLPVLCNKDHVRQRVRRFSYELWLFNYDLNKKRPIVSAYQFYNTPDFKHDLPHPPKLYRRDM